MSSAPTPAGPGKQSNYDRLADAIVEAVSLAVNRRLAPIEKRIVELEKMPFSYEGVYEPGKAYRRNSFCTHEGSLWCAVADTSNRPGEGPSGGWVLAAKRGKDGKDAR